MYCVSTSLTFCFCQAAASLCNACCGNDKPSTVPPSAASGRKRSIIVLFLSIGLALAYQWGIAPTLVESKWDIPYLVDAWLDDCEEFNSDEDLQKACAGINGNYRVSFATTLFFFLAAIGAACKVRFLRRNEMNELEMRAREHGFLTAFFPLSLSSLISQP